MSDDSPVNDEASRGHGGSGRRRGVFGRAVRRVLAVVALARVTQSVEVVLFPLVAVQRGAGAAGGALVLLALAVGSTAGSVLVGPW